MSSRREFYQGSDEAGSAGFHPAVNKAVYDERFACARAFAAEAERRGWEVAPIRGDITAFWLQELSRLWDQGPASVAGMTEDNLLFCLERLAWDAGVRVVCRRREAEGGLVSWTIARA